MTNRVLSISIKPSDKATNRLVSETKRIIIAKGLPSFSYIMAQALKEYMEKHHDLTI